MHMHLKKKKFFLEVMYLVLKYKQRVEETKKLRKIDKLFVFFHISLLNNSGMTQIFYYIFE